MGTLLPSTADSTARINISVVLPPPPPPLTSRSCVLWNVEFLPPRTYKINTWNVRSGAQQTAPSVVCVYVRWSGGGGGGAGER